jgi:16S rRNA (uracil1498-N3)-methyltransferase
MQIFYAPGISGDYYSLDEKESRHSIRVLRMKKGMQVRLIDGKGNLYEGTISEPDPKKCVIKIESVSRDFELKNYSLHLAISPLKNPERFEWFIEKSVEIGVDEITPLICRNTEKQGIRSERINNIIISAMKQSLKSKKTILHEASTFEDFIRCNHNGIKMIAHCNATFKRRRIADVYKKGEDAIVIIGPEGDFSEAEIGNAVSRGFEPVHLGNSRLRTETAGIAACHSVYFINQ